MSKQPFRFVFLIGASGSGTTLLTRLIGAQKGCVALGGNHISIARKEKSAYSIARKFKKANDRLWDRHATSEDSEAGGRKMLELIEQLLAVDNYKETSHILFKRSAPFHRGDRYRPDLSEIFRLFEDVRLIFIHRDPRASAASSHRRRFAKNLRANAVITEEQLTYLSAQLATLDPTQYMGFPYEDFCREPVLWMRRIATYCGLPEDLLEQAVRAEKIDTTRNEAWKNRLDENDRNFLETFFDERRIRQWPLLGQPHIPE
ncbi:MAG: sulfotransferase [Thermoanaerobaculales bacterium]|nr:sulfotransferase [Thermoanaerobaculales bacterium]